MTENEQITESCGNVYADLGLPNAEELQQQAILVIQAAKTLKASKQLQLE